MTAPSAAEIRAYIDAGQSQLEAAEHFGLSRSRVQRILKSHAAGDRVREVEELAETLGRLDAASKSRLGVLRSLAAKLDWAQGAQTAGAALALAPLSKQFLDLLAVVEPPAKADMEWLGGIFARFDEHAMTRALDRIASGTLSAEEAAAVASEALPRTQPPFARVGNFDTN